MFIMISSSPWFFIDYSVMFSFFYLSILVSSPSLHFTHTEYRNSWTYQKGNPLHIIHSDSLNHGLSVCNLFKYSLVSLNVEMHTYCYRWTHKACRAGLEGWYTAALLLPLGILCSVAYPPLKTEETFTYKCANVCAPNIHIEVNKPALWCRCFVFKENSKWRHTRASWCF